MWVTDLSLFAVIFMASMILWDQRLTADQQGKSQRYKKTRRTGMWVGFALSAILLFLSLMPD